MNILTKAAAALLCTTACFALPAHAQTASNIDVIQVLMPFSQLMSTAAGQTALKQNLATSIAVNNGADAESRAQAIHDYTIDLYRGTTLADGLGPKLQSVYFNSIFSGDPRTTSTTSSAVMGLFTQANLVAVVDAGAAKNFFGSGTVNGYPTFTPVRGVSLPAGGQYNIYDAAYGPLVPPQQTNLSGDSRPYQVAPTQIQVFSAPTFVAPEVGGTMADTVGPVASSAELNSGLTASAAFPSGHTTYGYTTSLLFAMMVPEMYQEMMTRGSEFGDGRIVLGAHYALDVIGGRITATHDLVQLLNNNPDYVGQSIDLGGGYTVTVASDFWALFEAATVQLRAVLEDGCGTDIATCVASQAPDRFSNYAKNKADYEYRLTYGLSPTGRTDLAPVVPVGAEVLLVTRFPYLSAEQRREVLATTEIASGGPLDDGSGWARLNLFAAAGGYGAFRIDTTVTMDARLGGFNAMDTWLNDISGPGRLTKAGTGSLFLAGANSFGGVDVEGGILGLTGDNVLSGASSVGGAGAAASLIVSGTLATSALDVRAQGVLMGAGTVTAPVTIGAGGTLAPGNGAVGTLTINGNLRLLSGAATQIEVAAGAADKVSVSGTATLGGVVNVSGARGDFEIGARYAIVTADGGRVGTFDSAAWDQSMLFLDTVLSYDADTAYVSLGRSAVAFADAARSANAVATAQALDTLGVGNAAWDAVVEMTDPGTANAAFNALSGEVYASTRGVLIERSSDVRDTLVDRMRDTLAPGEGAAAGLSRSQLVASYADPAKASAGAAAITKAVAPAPVPGYTFWGQGYGNFGRAWANGNAATVTQSTGGFLMGVDARVGDDWRVGVAGGYSSTSMDVDDRNSSASSDNYTAALYAAGRFGGLALRLGGAYTWNDVSTSRTVAFPGLQESLSSGSDLGTAQAFADIGYDLSVGAFALEPFAGLAYVSLSGGAFTEGFGGAALTGASTDTDVTFTTLGLRTSTEAVLGGATYRVLAGLGWRHAFGDVDPTATLAFAAGSLPFTVEGAPIAEDAALVEAGLGVRFSPTARLDFTYLGQLATPAVDNSFKGTFSLRF
ncbi:autotransporter domain-containing protein [Xanthobacter agilis]|uniref:autotransporter domain-containing protein n=1 Tax=Xanthobacter agilis TaxID=47492 RepID=UPI00372B7624